MQTVSAGFIGALLKRNAVPEVLVDRQR